MKRSPEKFNASVTILKAEAEGDGKRRKFSMVAYTGTEISRYWGRMIVDLDGVEVPARLPMLHDHQLSIAGVAEKSEVTKEGLVLSGYLSSTAPSGKYIADMVDEMNYPWTASIGVQCVEEVDLKEGEEKKVNGRLVKGPVSIWAKSRLFETSFVTANPADKETSVAVLSNEEGAPPPAKIEDLRAQAKKAERDAFVAYKSDMFAAFPGRADFASKMISEGKSVLEAKAELGESLVAENASLKAEAEKRAATVEKLRKDAGGSGFAFPFDGVKSEKGDDRLVASGSVEERASAEWRRESILRALCPAQEGGDKLYRHYVQGEENAKLFLTQPGFGLPPRFRVDLERGPGDTWTSPSVERAAAALVRATDMVKGQGTVERMAGSWGRSGHDYSAITVKGFLSYLFKPLEEDVGGSWATKVGLVIPSNQKTETHKWLGNYPLPRVWVGNRQLNSMPLSSMTITNEIYESTVDFDVEDFRFDKTGEIMVRLGEAGIRARQHWETLTTAVLLANGNCYDGKAFFATNHYNIGSASAGSQSNLFTNLTLAALNSSTPEAPTQQEFVNAVMSVIQKFYGFQDHVGAPVNGNARKFLVMVPPNMWGAAKTAITAARLNYGQDNPLLLQDYSVEVVPNGWLTTTAVGATTNTKTIYVFRVDSNFRPIVLQDVSGWESQFLGPGSEQAVMKNKLIFGLKAVRAAAVGAWEHAISATFG